MRLHPRTLPVQAAEAKLTAVLWNFQDSERLTYAEMLGLLAAHQQQILKYMLRAERHPDDPEKKADEE